MIRLSFTEFSFWLIFPAIFVIYWACPSKFNVIRKSFLIIVSYLLYLNWDPSFAIVLVAITLVTYFGGLVLSRNKGRALLCWVFAIIAFAPLLAFKYYNFINSEVNALLEYSGLHFSLPGLNWAIPVGVSFFSFQAVGYMLDVYHGRSEVETNLVDYVLFVCFFPQLTSGPISTSAELMPQIKNPHKFNYLQGRKGLEFLLWGMFVKLVIADRLGTYVDLVFGHYDYYSWVSCLTAVIYYSIQIYCDFSGYSLMAVGIAATLGFDLVNNFKRPYFAASVTEFWRRWHISLTRWLTTHVYIGMGGNRCSKLKQYFNILVTFLASGLWHGANWTFLLWGMMHGFLQIIEKALFGNKIREEIRSSNRSITLSRMLRIVMTFFLVSSAWIFFRMPSIADGWNMICRIAGMSPGQEASGSLIFVAIFGFAVLFIHEFREEFITRKPVIQSKWNSAFRWICCSFLFIVILLYGVLDGSTFIYASF